MIYSAKVIVLGDETVGKTSIIKRYVNKVFSEIYRATIGVDISYNIVNINGKELKLSLWDVSGQSVFNQVRAKFYKESDAAVLVFDLTRQKTFNNLYRWRKELYQNSGKKDIPLVLIGNKTDLENFREVQEEDIIDFVLKNPDVPYFKASAKTGKAVEEIFQEVGKLIMQNNN
ncbi:MAG: Rab family GTPase [Candidatus Hermodarchaeota archaeon]